MNLVIDIGNTVAKIAVFDLEGSIVEVQYSSNTLLTNTKELCSKYLVTKGIVASVTSLTTEVRKYLDALNIPLLWLDHTTHLPIENKYKTPKTLGYDRVAGVVGAYVKFPNKNILVIDAGTAITYDFINSNGQYCGGNISPGLRMRLRALHDFTGKLPLVVPGTSDNLLGKSTEDAIRSGVTKGIEYEMLGYVQELKREYPDLLVFLTGGNDFSFETKLKNGIFADRFLVIKGLNRILNYNYNKWDEQKK